MKKKKKKLILFPLTASFLESTSLSAEDQTKWNDVRSTVHCKKWDVEMNLELLQKESQTSYLPAQSILTLFLIIIPRETSCKPWYAGHDMPKFSYTKLPSKNLRLLVHVMCNHR